MAQVGVYKALDRVDRQNSSSGSAKPDVISSTDFAIVHVIECLCLIVHDDLVSSDAFYFELHQAAPMPNLLAAASKINVSE